MLLQFAINTILIPVQQINVRQHFVHPTIKWKTVSGGYACMTILGKFPPKFIL